MDKKTFLPLGGCQIFNTQAGSAKVSNRRILISLLIHLTHADLRAEL